MAEQSTDDDHNSFCDENRHVRFRKLPVDDNQVGHGYASKPLSFVGMPSRILDRYADQDLRSHSLKTWYRLLARLFEQVHDSRLTLMVTSRP